MIGVIIIGRNEGERLIDCLKSVLSADRILVYVDSNSTDTSILNAKALGVDVVELDMNQPFTAARARNAGFRRLLQINSTVEYVQFVDGDCMVDSGWVGFAQSTLQSQPEVAVVCGRRRERFPEASIYNRLCDTEWNTPIGEKKACGGDFMIRTNCFQSVNGFDDSLIAGEEPELCIRLRRQGYKILRLDAEMTLHDANMHRLGQWWKRSVRAGYAFAEGACRYGKAPERHWVTEKNKAWLWAAFIPVIMLCLSVYNPYFLAGVLIYPLQVARLACREDVSRVFSWQYAFFLTLGKFPELQGQLCFWLDKFKRAESTIIEYK